MLMVIFLLSVFSIPKVWLKPSLTNSELAIRPNGEELRSKRQATFFDLLHQAIEKYVNCADNHLAPIKSLTNYKQYETLIPAKYFETNKDIVGASQFSPNKSNVKCTKLNLCFIPDQNYFSETTDKALDTKIDLTKRLPYFSTNGNYKNKQPSHAFGNIPMKQSVKFPDFKKPYNQEFLNLFFNKPPIVDSRKQIFKVSEPKTVLGSPPSKTPINVKTNFCPCSNKTIKDARFQSTNQQYYGEVLNSCSCLETVASKTISLKESQEFEQNLNQLLMQLDEMAERANNGELKQILEKLKHVKPTLDTVHQNKDDPSSVTPTAPLLLGSQASNTPQYFNFSKLGLSILNTIFKRNTALKAVKSSKNTSNKFNAEHVKNNSFFESHILKNSSQLKSKDSQAAFGSQNETKSYDHVGITHPFASKLNISNMKNDNLANSNDFIRQESKDALAESPTLLLIPKNAQICADSNEGSDILGSIFEPENLEESSSETITELTILPFKNHNKENERKTFVSPENTYAKRLKTKQTTAFNRRVKPQLSVVSRHYKNIQTAISDPQTNSSKVGKNDSKITISITSNGDFKHIQVEHVSDNKKLEINEKEKINMATPRYKGQSKDMLGIDSRFVNIVKEPQKNEPILLQIYPAKSKPSTNAPVSIYLHKIEKQPSKLKRATKGVWKTIQSSDIFDCGSCEQHFAVNSNKNKDTSYTKGLNTDFT